MNKLDEPRRPNRTPMMIAALLTTSVLAGGAVVTHAWRATAAEPIAIASTMPTMVSQSGFADLVAKVKPAVVNIATTGMVEHVDESQTPDLAPGTPFGEMFPNSAPDQHKAPQHALGSGFIVDPAGYIVTNNHVIEGATKIMITLTNGSTYPATIKGRDAKMDVALLKIDAPKDLPFVSFGDSDKAREGDWVVAVGNPFGLGGTVTAGIVSAHGRDIQEGPYDNFLQIDAPINPGNSGGPVFDQSGRVIGIDTAIYSPTGGSVGIGFAIPSDLASKVVAQLRDHGSVERGWLGVQMQPITPALAKAMGRPDADGVIIDKVESDSPAASADLHQGDVIAAIDGKAVKGPREVALAVANLQKDSSAMLTIWRDGHEQSVKVKVGATPEERTAAVDEGQSNNPIGLSLAPLLDDQRAELGLNDKTKGVVIAQVTPDSRAAESGLRPGDVIVQVGSEPVSTPSDVISKLHAAEHTKKEAVPLLVMREGTAYYLALQLTVT